MKHKLWRSMLLLLVLCLIGTGAVACDKGTGDGTDTTGSDTPSTDLSDESYQFPASIDLADRELNIFNFDDYYDAIIYTATEEYGDKIPKAVYDRNMRFEEQYKIAVVEDQLAFTSRGPSFEEATLKLSTAYMGGDDIYDIAYVSLFEQYTLISMGVLKNLNEVSTIDLTAEWWDPQFNNSFILQDGKCYVAVSALNLMPYEMTWLIFFNRTMAQERDLPDLFEYVRKGEWTVETMMMMICEYGILTENATGGYTFEANGTATYGIGLHSQSASHLLMGFDITFTQAQENGTYTFACSNTDLFASANTWLKQIFTRDTGITAGSDYSDPVSHPEGYVPIFHNGRSLFMHMELKTGMYLKKILNSEVNYGMLPQPKLTEEQDTYYSSLANSTMMLAIPSINDEAEATGAAADVLSYLSYTDVLPIYYNDYVSYRNVSDPDSLEMLNDYIMPGRRMEIGKIYGWTTDFINAYDSLLYSGGAIGNDSLANILDRYTESVNQKIESFFN